MMATLVVGPFYLTRALTLSPAVVGAVLSAGPLVAALAGLPAGRVVDRVGARWLTTRGLVGIAAGAGALAVLPARLGLAGYLAPVIVMTASYALFQAANNTAVMTGIGPDERGVVASLLNLARNLGLITGASAMGSVFAYGVGSIEPAAGDPDAVAAGMRFTFGVATVLVAMALTVVATSSATAPARGADISAVSIYYPDGDLRQDPIAVGGCMAREDLPHACATVDDRFTR